MIEQHDKFVNQEDEIKYYHFIDSLKKAKEKIENLLACNITGIVTKQNDNVEVSFHFWFTKNRTQMVKKWYFEYSRGEITNLSIEIMCMDIIHQYWSEHENNKRNSN